MAAPAALRSEEEWDAIPAQESGLDAEERILLQHALAAIGEEERRIVLLHAITGRRQPESSIFFLLFS